MTISIRLSVFPPLLLFFILSRVHGYAPVSSPAASTDLICHTAHASECYPAIFQPTEHFQRIHDDQSIPAGLHVRMNLATGLKEARLNVPEPPGTPHADLVIIDDLPPRPRIEEDDRVTKVPELQDQSHPDSGNERIGHFHPAALNVEESSLFHSSITALRSTTMLSDTDLPALSALQDLAHSIHWGVALVQDAAACRSLLSAIDPGSTATGEIRSAAALLLGTAVHSNPDALDALLSNPYSSEAGVTPAIAVLTVLRDQDQADITLKTRTVFLLSQLCQDTEQLRIFVHSGGLDTFFDLFESDRTTLHDGKDRFRAKVANFIYDRILSSLGGVNGLASQADPSMSALASDQALVKGLEPWCNAFTKALKMYKLVGMSAENPSPAADAALKSIKETNQALKEAHAHLGICENESEL